MVGIRPKENYLATVSGALDRLSIGKTFLYKLLQNQELEKVVIGRRTLITIRSIEALIEKSIQSGAVQSQDEAEKVEILCDDPDFTWDPHNIFQ
jgi:hypothetical protein